MKTIFVEDEWYEQAKSMLKVHHVPFAEGDTNTHNCGKRVGVMNRHFERMVSESEARKDE
jgi:hypothetical protein